MKSLHLNKERIRRLISKSLSINNVNSQERKFVLKTRALSQCKIGLALILMLLTACSGGGIETNFSVDNNGFNFQTGEPEYFANEPFTTELPLINHLKIRLKAFRGEIEIEGRDGVNSVIVMAQKWVGADNLQDAEANLNELEILVTDQIDEVLIQTLQPDDALSRKYIVDYQIILPKGLEIEVFHTNGDINILNIENRVTVDSDNSNIFLSNISASVFVSLANGSIDSSIELPLDGEIMLSTNNGDIDLTLPSSTSAAFSSSTNNGSISIFNLEIDAAVQTIQSLTGTLGNGDGVINLSSINGNIKVVGVD